MIKKFSFNAFYIIFGIFSLWIFFSGFFHATGNIPANFIMLFGASLVLLFSAYVATKSKEISEKYYKITVIAIFAIFYIALTSFGIITMTVPISDLEVLIQSADHWLENGNILSYSSYFTVCRNTLGNAIFIYLMYIPIHLLGINIYSNIAESYGIAINCLMIVLAVFCLYRISVRVIKNRNFQILFLLLCCVYIPFYLWAHRYYSDTLSLPFLTLGILLYIKSQEHNDKSKIFYSILCGIILWFGYFMKGSIIIALVAILIYSAFCDKKDFIKSGLIVVLSFIFTFIIGNLYINHNSWIDFSNQESSKYPITMWLMYGAHDEGNYSDEDVNLLSSYEDYETKKQVAYDKLKEYYSQYNLKTYIEFLNLKYGITYGNGLFDAEKYLNNQRHSNFTHQFLLPGMPFTPIFTYIANGLHFATLLLSVISGFINYKKRKWNIAMLFHITMMGNIIFFSFWETKARYAFGITPILLFLTIYSLYNILEFIYDKKQSIK